MPAKSISTNLSQRGELAASGGAESVVWEVINNLWDPHDNPDGYFSLGIAENTLMHEELAQYIEKSIKIPLQAFTYGDGPIGSKRLRAAMSRFLNKHLEPIVPITPGHVIVTNGVSTAIEHCSWAIANPGDGFLLGQPYYGAFLSDIGLRPGVKVVTVKFGTLDPCGFDAISKYEDAILASQREGVNIKGLMLCSPHNPLGRCYSRETIIGFMKLCQKYQIHLVSDEIYALSTWKNTEDPSPPPVEFVSALSIDLTEIIYPSLVHVLWGMSKDFGANGLRIGAIISQSNPAFVTAVCTTSLYSYSSSISDLIAADILEDDAFTENYIQTNQERLTESYSFAVQFLRKHRIDYVPGANAAFFLWVNLGKAYLDRHPDDVPDVSKITLEAPDSTKAKKAEAEISSDDITAHVMSKLLQRKIFLASGTNFGSEEPGWFRIVFSQSREYLENGLKRIIEAIE